MTYPQSKSLNLNNSFQLKGSLNPHGVIFGPLAVRMLLKINISKMPPFWLAKILLKTQDIQPSAKIFLKRKEIGQNWAPAENAKTAFFALKGNLLLGVKGCGKTSNPVLLIAPEEIDNPGEDYG